MAIDLKKFPKWAKIITVCVAVILFGLFSFYHMSFQRLSEIIDFSNRGTTSISLEEEIISKEDRQKITFVKKPDSKHFYVNGLCIPLLKGIGIGEVTFSCVAQYRVYDSSQKVIQEVKDQAFQVKMKFSDWKWVVQQIY